MGEIITCQSFKHCFWGERYEREEKKKLLHLRSYFVRLKSIQLENKHYYAFVPIALTHTRMKSSIYEFQLWLARFKCFFLLLTWHHSILDGYLKEWIRCVFDSLFLSIDAVFAIVFNSLYHAMCAVQFIDLSEYIINKYEILKIPLMNANYAHRVIFIHLSETLGRSKCFTLRTIF